MADRPYRDEYQPHRRQEQYRDYSPRRAGDDLDYGRGRGPRGYRRSDERIREDVCDVLTDDANVDATEIEVTVKEGEVTLTGSVASRDQKRRAESLAERVSGVRDVHNSVRVGAA
jgi:osmotically-inducible protein OsmY